MDVPGESMNTLKASFADEIRHLLAEVKGERGSDRSGGIVSGKKGLLHRGADIAMLAACTSAQDAESLSRAGQDVFAEIESLGIPVIAAIHGPCLGGGLGWRSPAMAGW